MADKKITELTAITDAAEADVIPIVSISGNETKKITKANFLKLSRVDTSLPGSPFAGSCYFNTDTFKFYIYTGAAWKEIQLG